MGWSDIKICPADTAFSRLIRLRDKKCVLCSRKGTGDEGIFGLQASHYYSRKKWNTRYDPDNVWSLCISCHQQVHKDNSIYETYMIKKLGQKEFDYLTLRAWAKSPLGSSYWKSLTKKQAEALFAML